MMPLISNRIYHDDICYPDILNFCMLGDNFACFCCCLLTFFKIDYFKKKFKTTIRVSNGLDPDHDRHFVSPDLGPNCLQTLSADDYSHCQTASKQRVKFFSV